MVRISLRGGFPKIFYFVHKLRCFFSVSNVEDFMFLSIDRIKYYATTRGLHSLKQLFPNKTTVSIKKEILKMSLKSLIF